MFPDPGRSRSSQLEAAQTSGETLRRTGLGSRALAGDLLSSRIGSGDRSSRGDLRGDRLLATGDLDRPFITWSKGADLLRDRSMSRRGDGSGELMLPSKLQPQRNATRLPEAKAVAVKRPFQS